MPRRYKSKLSPSKKGNRQNKFISSDLSANPAYRNILTLTLILLAIGLIAVADVSAPLALRQFSDKFYFVKQQLVWSVIGLTGLFVLSNLDYRFWSRLAVPIFFLNVLLLVLVLIPGIGPSILGAKRWIYIGGLHFQPSELIKFSVAIYMAKLAEEKKQVLAYFIPLGLVGLLLMLEPDLGTTIVVVMIAMSQIFIAGINILHFVGASVLGILISFVLIITSSYRRERLMTYLQQTNDPLGKGYHIRQILIALGSGGMFGVGLGQSRQKYLFVPETATDSIFAIIAEEVGFIGALVIIIIFLLFVIRSIQVALHTSDVFGKVLAIGIVSWIGGQVILNISSMVALVPLTGIPLPLISYGGSSLISILVAIGILLNIAKNAD